MARKSANRGVISFGLMASMIESRSVQDKPFTKRPRKSCFEGINVRHQITDRTIKRDSEGPVERDRKLVLNSHTSTSKYSTPSLNDNELHTDT
jgi:hypothetical protein